MAAPKPKNKPAAKPKPKPKAGSPQAKKNAQIAKNTIAHAGAGKAYNAMTNPGGYSPSLDGSDTYDYLKGNPSLAKLISHGSSTYSSLDLIPKSMGGLAPDDSRLNALLSAYGIPDITTALEAYNVAGLDQYRMNQSGQRQQVASNPVYQNVAMDQDINALLRMVGEMSGAIQRGGGAVNQLKQTWQGRIANMPDYAMGVASAMKDQGVVDPVTGLPRVQWDLLGDPSINYRDPTKLLFDPKGTHPHSLFGLTGFQSGEEQLYAPMSAEDLLRSIGPINNAYYNRGAGKPAEGPGPMFGDMQYNPALSGNFMDNPEGLYQMSPVRSSDPYKRAQAYGMIGVDPEKMGQLMVGSPWLPGASFNALTGTGSPGDVSGNKNIVQMLLSGAVKPEYFANGMNEWMGILQDYLSPLGMSAALNDPSYYWNNTPYAQPYAPQNIDPNIISRYQQLAALLAGGQ